jgi:hypothetical protein
MKKKSGELGTEVTVFKFASRARDRVSRAARAPILCHRPSLPNLAVPQHRAEVSNAPQNTRTDRQNDINPRSIFETSIYHVLFRIGY